MAKYALYVSLKAKAGKAAEVEAFLKQGAQMSRAESGTVTWYGIKEDDGAYAVFDTFDDEACLLYTSPSPCAARRLSPP